jgi:hypothetical protein
LARGLSLRAPHTGAPHDALYGAPGGACRRVSGGDGPGERHALSRPAAGGAPGATCPGPRGRRGRGGAAIDDGRRGKGERFGAFRPAAGEALTVPSAGRPTATSVASLARVEDGMPPALGRLSAVVGHLSAHRATAGLLCSRAHPRWEFVFQPQEAPSLHLIEPWWNGWRSWAVQGRRVEAWAAGGRAGEDATQDGNAHRPPVIGACRRHRPRRRPGLGRLPIVA